MNGDRWNTPERMALRRSAYDFATREVVPYIADWEDAGEVPRALHKRAADACLLGVGFPESVGGQGGGAVEAAIITEAVIEAGGSSGLIAALFTHGIALPHIIAAARDDAATDLVDRYVRPTLAGDAIGALAVTEPGGGSDVAGLVTRAWPVDGGSAYLVDGTKTFITSGLRADFVTTAVRTGGEGANGISLLVIDKSAAGFEVGRPLRKLGWWCSDTAELSFTDVRVPAFNLVGAPGTGAAQIMRQFTRERLSLAVQAYATARRCLDLAVEYAKQRTTFGRPLVSRQVIRHKLVDMRRRTVTARAYTRGVLEQLDAGDADERQLGLDACLAKNDAVDACDFVADSALQIFGGAGYLRDSEVERHYRDARILGIGGGANEVLSDLAARLWLGSAS